MAIPCADAQAHMPSRDRNCVLPKPQVNHMTSRRSMDQTRPASCLGLDNDLKNGKERDTYESTVIKPKTIHWNQDAFDGIRFKKQVGPLNSLGLECCSIRIVHPLGTLKAEVVELLLKEYEGTRESWEKLGPEVILTFKL